MAGLRITADGRVSTVTVNRPDVLNALNTALLEEFLATLIDLGADESVGVVIITGAGDRAFIAGADIKEMDGKTPLEARAYSELGQEIAHKLETMRKPTIAAVNGYALGGGCEIALACDVRLASENARFGQPEINLGIIPGFGGTQRLPRLVGEGKALELNLLGQPIGAYEAERLGLVNQVVPDHELFDTTISWARYLAKQAPVAIEQIKTVSATGELGEGLEAEAHGFARAFGSEDAKEGIAAFLGKRTPKFQGK